MAFRATLLALLIASCKAPAPPAAPAAAAASCLDQQLAARGLNEFGDPPGTMYAGGTPLFDEASGKRVDRKEYVLRKHPDLARACSADGG
jgi:hypothetical protein